MWKYKGKKISQLQDFPNEAEGSVGFVYEVTHKPSGKKYIGKKVFFHNYKLPPLKGRKRKRRRVRESDWKTYVGSSKIMKQLLTESKVGLQEFDRHILKVCSTKKQLSYYEAKLLFEKDVLNSSVYVNDNILGKFFLKDL